MKDGDVFPEEIKRLQDSIQKLNDKTNASKNAFQNFLDTVQKQSIYLSESYNEIDPEERVQVKSTIQNIEKNMHDELGKQAFYEKAIKSPFFGRVDWLDAEEEKPEPYFIGISGIENQKGKAPLVCDWRAPISSLFYDFEKGKAFYEPPQGKIEGTIVSKRQFKVEDGKFVFGIDVNETIADEILKEALCQNSGGSMKTIVSTIQKEQNEIIRRNPNDSIVLQGIAGSGKTSIALHRIAYLLYRQKETLDAQNVLVISPSLIFSKFIGNVLPELGEDSISQLTFDSIAKDMLHGFALSESRESMLSALLCEDNTARKSDIDKKSSFEFLESMKSSLAEIFKSAFLPSDLTYGNQTVKAEVLLDLWNKNYETQTVATKIDWLADFVVEEISPDTKRKTTIFDRIKKVLMTYVTPNNPLTVLALCYEKCGLEFKEKSKNVVFYEDIAPLMLICDYMFSTKKNSAVKCLIVDEMQDHTPIFFYLLKKMYSCPTIVLGDINQSIEHTYSMNYLAKLTKFMSASFINLNKSYRSTVEISEYAQRLIGVKGANNFNRHGNPVALVNVPNFETAAIAANKLAKVYLTDKANTALVCVDPLHEDTMLNELTKLMPCTNLYDMDKAKLIVASANDCKGMEFDNVIVFGKEPKTFEQKKALHIASTRALHNLFVISLSK